MKISVRQICFIMLVYTAVTKFVLYPNMLSFSSGRDLLFSALLDFFIQGVIIWAVSYLCSRTDKTLFELLEYTFGNIVARIIFGLFALFFILCAIIPLFEQKLYVHTIFYDTVPSLVAFLPFFFFALYAGVKDFSNIGRCADICLPVFAISIIFIFAMSFLEVDWTSFLPILKTPAKDVLGGSLSTVYRFYEPCWLLMFMGRFKYKKGDSARITLSYAGGAVAVLLVLIAFYGIYSEIAPSRPFAISKISLFFPAIDVVGRIDLIALYALEFTMLFAVVLNIQLAVYCLTECTGFKYKVIFSVAVNLILAILLFTLDNEFNALQTFFSNWMWIVFVIFANILPLLAWTLKGKQTAKEVQND